jgi:hypothetical protein
VLSFEGGPGCPKETYPQHTVSEQIITPDKSGGEKIARNNLGYSEGGKKAKKEH